MSVILVVLYSYLLLALGIKITKIPDTGTPPQSFSRGSLVYHQDSNLLISFGGYITKTKEYISDLFTFNLTDFSWSTIIPGSDYKPPGLLNAYTAIYLDQIYVFFGQKYEGISSDIYKFDLVDYKWEVVVLQGTAIPGRLSYSFTSFTYLDSPYVAIFGGLTHKGRDNELYM